VELSKSLESQSVMMTSLVDRVLRAHKDARLVSGAARHVASAANSLRQMGSEAAKGIAARVWLAPTAAVRSIEEDFSIEVPLGYTIPSYPHRARVAVVCHVFYVEVADEIYRILTNINFSADLFVSTDTPAKLDVLKRIFGAWQKGAVELRLVPNRGRDVAPKFCGFRDAVESYDLILFLHSKKTEQRKDGALWRQTLMQTLAGSRETVDSIIYAFQRFPSLGIVFPQHYEPIRRDVNWGTNYHIARRLGHRMGFKIKPHGFLDFPSGSMFWARSSALRPLTQLDLRITDFPEANCKLDGTTAHAIERLVLYACEHAGFGWIKVASPPLFSNRSTIVTIGSPRELDDFVLQHRVKLLRNGKRRNGWSA
jgi:hypothetical protein